MKKNQIIVFTNIKGGTGKTQICATAATHMVQLGIPIIVIDADIQQSLSRHRTRDHEARPSDKAPWDCVFLNTTDYSGVEQLLEKAKKLPACVLIDCPGNINDPSLQLIFRAADIAVVPFELNADSVDATVIFSELFRQHYTAKMYFIPNKVSNLFWRRGEVRKAREDAMELLDKKLGKVTPDVKLSTNMNGYSTLDLLCHEKRKLIHPAIVPVLQPIYKLFKNK